MTNTSDRAVTLADVARLAGYSRSTASLVLRSSPLVAESTRQQVLRAAEKLGYVYNRRAAGLRMQRSNTIGLLVAGLANPFFADLTEAIEDELGPSGYTLLLGNTLDDQERQASLIRTLLEYRVDGLLIVPANGSTRDIVAPLAGLHTPHVLLTRRGADSVAPYVGSNDRHAGRMAAEHLHEHGCERIAYFGGPENADVRIERDRGVMEVCLEHGMQFDRTWSMRTQTSSTAGHAAAASLLDGSPLPDGIVVHSDAIAFGLMRSLRDAGVRVGEDVRVIGFDDVEHAKYWSPALSTISVNARRIGQVAVRMLLERIADPDIAPQSNVFEPELQIRESCGSHDDHRPADIDSLR